MLTSMGKLIPPFECDDSEITGVAAVNILEQNRTYLWLYLNSCPVALVK